MGGENGDTSLRLDLHGPRCRMLSNLEKCCLMSKLSLVNGVGGWHLCVCVLYLCLDCTGRCES